MLRFCLCFITLLISFLASNAQSNKTSVILIELALGLESANHCRHNLIAKLAINHVIRKQ